VDLSADRLDYLLTATLPEAATDLGKRLRSLRGVPIPVRLSGPIADPQVALDIEAALRGVARLRLEHKLEERLDGKLGDKLRSLLGR
jgi:AsmA protein